MGIGQTIGYLKHMIPQYTARDSIILADQSRKCEKNRVNLHWYAMGCDTEKQNVGDYLSTVVVEQMKLRAGVDDGRDLSQTRHLYAIGSILQAGFQNAAVWGSGFIADPTGSRLGAMLHSSRLRTLDVRAVRGPLTRQALLKLGHECPAIYGDPAILMPLFYTPAEREKRKYSFVGHYADKCSQGGDSLQILTTDYRHFLNELVRGERVISSSLHGIILAESYGVPAVLYRPEGLDLPIFKYEDYYLGTGRSSFPVAKTVEEALAVIPCPVPDFTEQRQRLYQAFPADIWAD